MAQRTGKIARLSREIREELNRRLDDGESGTTLLLWLNAQPAAQTVLQNEFGGRPLSPQNLSEWRHGGYRDWQDKQEVLELVPELANQTETLNAAANGALTDQLATWATARLLVLLQRLSAADTDDATKYERLREACAQIVKLRRGDHSAERLKLRREEVVRERDIALHKLDELFTEWREHPEIKARYFCPDGMTKEESVATELQRRSAEISGIDPEFDPSRRTNQTNSNQIKPHDSAVA